MHWATRWHHFTLSIVMFFGFFPGNVHVLQVLSDDVHPVFSSPFRLSLVAPPIPTVLLNGLFRSCLFLVISTCPSNLSLLSLMICFNFCNPLMFLFLCLSLVFLNLQWVGLLLQHYITALLLHCYHQLFVFCVITVVVCVVVFVVLVATVLLLIFCCYK